jgi:glycosyltransferase involved in cell wall biosynthesis
MDLVRHGENAWLVEPEDAEALAEWTARIATSPAAAAAVVARGLDTARANAYDAQLPLWRGFFDGFVAAR